MEQSESNQISKDGHHREYGYRGGWWWRTIRHGVRKPYDSYKIKFKRSTRLEPYLVKSETDLCALVDLLNSNMPEGLPSERSE